MYQRGCILAFAFVSGFLAVISNGRRKVSFYRAFFSSCTLVLHACIEGVVADIIVQILPFHAFAKALIYLT